MFGKRGMEFLKGVKLQEQRRMALDNYLKVLEVLNEVIEEVESKGLTMCRGRHEEMNVER
jgi:hypothetical protein